MKLRMILAGAALLTLQACGSTTGEAGKGTGVGIDIAAMDTSVDPGDDFYAYANGKWMENNEIPADRGSIGGFLIAAEETERQLSALMDDILSNDHPDGSVEAKIKNYYEAYVDVDAINAAGMKPLEADFARFAAIETRSDLSRVLGEQLQVDVDPLNNTNYNTPNLFGIFVSQGLSTPGETLPYLLQGGIGLPEREYYLSNSDEMKSVRDDYRAYAAKIFELAGFDDAAARAARVLALETKIAKAHLPRSIASDMQQSAQVWTRDELKQKASGIDWDAMLEAANLGEQQRFAAYHADAIPALAKLVASEPIQAWQDWLTFHQVDNNSAVLPTAIDEAVFDFYGRRLAGTQEQRPRDKRALGALQGDLGYAVGQLYTDRYFSADAKADVAQMVENIKAAFATRVEKIEWMAPATKEEAIRKVKGMEVGVGYPDTWPDYSGLEIGNSAYANRIAARDARTERQLAKIGKPMDRREWWMVPQLVNAVNLPVQNAMNFPAAILQPPFYDPTADAAFNYGAIGAVIGHEVSHSFDDNGALFDSRGTLNNWWTEADFAKFREEGDELARQFDAYSPFPGVNVNGKLTLGENISDVAGLEAAYEAYKASLGGKEAPVIDGLTGDQRFFIAYAQAWRSKMREGLMRQLIATDGHAPGNYRALSVRNLDAWYDAFDITPDDALYLAPEDRVQIW